MSLIPGVCFCVAPSLARDSDVLYTLYPNGFRRGSNQNFAEIFRVPVARSLGGDRALAGPGASVRSTSPVAKIDFYLGAPQVGEHLASPTQPGNCTGFMANSGYTGGASNRHLRGQGKWFVTSKQLAERIMSMMVPGMAIKNAGLGASSQEWAQVIDRVRGSGSNTATWLTQLQHVVMGSMNQVAIAYLIFR